MVCDFRYWRKKKRRRDKITQRAETWQDTSLGNCAFFDSGGTHCYRAQGRWAMRHNKLCKVTQIEGNHEKEVPRLCIPGICFNGWLARVPHRFTLSWETGKWRESYRYLNGCFSTKNINQAAKTFFADASERFSESHTLSIAVSLALLTSSFNAPATSVYYRAEMRK